MFAEVLAFHGWGFDRHCWQFWQERFTESGHQFQAFDRGYFGDSYQPSFKNSETQKTILAHSFGLHLCPIDLLQQADLLIAFNSFLSFHPESKAEKRRSQLVLQQMIRQFEQTPDAVLQEFYAQVGYSYSPEDHQEINNQILLEDLQRLNVSILDSSYLNSIAKIVVFHSANDRIVAASQTQEFLSLFPQSCKFLSLMNAEHGLPFTHAAECWSMVQSICSPAIPR